MRSTGRTEASYKLKTFRDGQVYVVTNTRWSRSFGKCNLQHFNRQGELLTQSRFRSWLKKYSLPINDSEIAQLPKSI